MAGFGRTTIIRQRFFSDHCRHRQGLPDRISAHSVGSAAWDRYYADDRPLFFDCAGTEAGARFGSQSARALDAQLRRAQTFLHILGIEIVFGREGRLGTRTIRITATGERETNTVSTVSRVSDRAGLNHPPCGLEQAL
jgi:hypothetical protein